MTFDDASRFLESGEATSQDLTRECLAAIEAHNNDINAFLRVYQDDAINAAQASDARRAKGETLGPLDGVPVAIKDNFSYKDHTTSAGSRMLEDYVAPYDATVVTKLKAAGAVIIGHLNMDEFAMGSSGENSAFGPTKNPLDTARVSGGSSSGAAAAVAANMVPLTFGSDTGGSIRLPAAFCGVVGLKPTYGAVSRYGLLAMASSLDQIGPLAHSVSGVKAAFETIRGLDNHDSTSKDTQLLPTKDRYRIGVPKQFLGEGLDDRIAQAVSQTLDQLAAAGHEIIRDIDMPLLDQSVAMYYLIVPAEVSANLARYDGIRYGLHRDSVVASRTEGFGSEVKRRIMLGTFALSAGYADQYYKRAQAARGALKQQFAEVFQTVDVLFGPVTPELPFKFGAKTANPLEMYLSDIYTVPVNLAGLPALSVPIGSAHDAGATLSIGGQLIGQAWGEAQLFDLAEAIETKERKI